MWWCCITGYNSFQSVSRSLVSAVYKAFHCSASACKLSLTAHQTVLVGLLYVSSSLPTGPLFQNNTSICQKCMMALCWAGFSSTDGPSEGMHCRTECDTAYYELFISVFCTWRLVLWSQLQTNLLHWDQIQNISCGSFVVNNHRDCPNA